MQQKSLCIDDSDSVDVDVLDAHHLMTDTAQSLAELFAVLSDPTRLRIIALLIDHELCVHTLEVALGMKQSAISHQLRVLRQANLVRYRKAGRHVYYALDDHHVRELFAQGLLHIKHG
jgi:ArsR family transcriptional regulator